MRWLQLGTWLDRSGLESEGERRERSLDVLGIDREGRREAHDIVAGGEDEQPTLAACADDVGGRHTDAGAEEKATAPHLEDAGK